MARLGCSVVLAERDSFDRCRIGEHVGPEIKPTLRTLGYDIEAKHHLASPGILSRWIDGTESERDYICSPFGSGHNLSRPAFESGLAEVAREAGVQMVTRANVELCERGQHWRFSLKCPDHVLNVSAKFAVDASGRQAWLLRQMRIRHVRLSHEAAAIAYLRRSRDDTDNRLIVERGRNGWWYSLPLSHGMRAVALITHPTSLAGSAECRAEFWRKELSFTCRISEYFPRLKQPSLITCPVGVQAAEKACGLNWIAIGDAAAAFDPLAGQGIHKALQDGNSLPSFLSAEDGRLSLNCEAYLGCIDRSVKAHLNQRSEFYAPEILQTQD